MIKVNRFLHKRFSQLFRSRISGKIILSETKRPIWVFAQSLRVRGQSWKSHWKRQLLWIPIVDWTWMLWRIKLLLILDQKQLRTPHFCENQNLQKRFYFYHSFWVTLLNISWIGVNLVSVFVSVCCILLLSTYFLT